MRCASSSRRFQSLPMRDAGLTQVSNWLQHGFPWVSDFCIILETNHLPVSEFCKILKTNGIIRTFRFLVGEDWGWGGRHAKPTHAR